VYTTCCTCGRGASIFVTRTLRIGCFILKNARSVGLHNQHHLHNYVDYVGCVALRGGFPTQLTKKSTDHPNKVQKTYITYINSYWYEIYVGLHVAQKAQVSCALCAFFFDSSCSNTNWDMKMHCFDVLP
jgi:uncharacterized protein YneR